MTSKVELCNFSPHFRK